MLAILVLVDCSTTSIDSSQLSAHLQRELTGSDPPGWRDPRGTGRPVEGERFTAICDDSSIRLRSESGVDLSVPFGDVAYAARARTVALAVAEHLRSAPEDEPAPKVELAENIPTPREESPWRISGSLEGGTTLKADGLLAGIGFDLTRTFGWFALHADALILGGSSDQKPLLAFIFRAAAAGDTARHSL